MPWKGVNNELDKNYIYYASIVLLFCVILLFKYFICYSDGQLIGELHIKVDRVGNDGKQVNNIEQHSHIVTVLEREIAQSA